MNVGTISVGSTQNLSAELLKSTAGINFQIVPYRGTPEVIVGLLREDIDVMIDNYVGMKSALQDGKMRPVGTTGESRSVILKDVPTMIEGGVKGYDVVSWNALFAPSGTPPEAIARLNAGLREVLAMPDVKQKLLDLGIEAKASSPEELKARLVDDIAQMDRRSSRRQEFRNNDETNRSRSRSAYQGAEVQAAAAGLRRAYAYLRAGRHRTHMSAPTFRRTRR